MFQSARLLPQQLQRFSFLIFLGIFTIAIASNSLLSFPISLPILGIAQRVAELFSLQLKQLFKALDEAPIAWTQPYPAAMASHLHSASNRPAPVDRDSKMATTGVAPKQMRPGHFKYSYTATGWAAISPAPAPDLTERQIRELIVGVCHRHNLVAVISSALSYRERLLPSKIGTIQSEQAGNIEQRSQFLQSVYITNRIFMLNHPPL